MCWIPNGLSSAVTLAAPALLEIILIVIDSVLLGELSWGWDSGSLCMGES